MATTMQSDDPVATQPGVGPKSSVATEREGLMRILMLTNPFWRIMQLCSTIIAFSVMIAADNGNGVRYSYFTPYLYLVVANVIAAAHSLLMMMIELFLGCTGRLLPILFCSYYVAMMDLVAMVLTLSAGSAAFGADTLTGHCAPGSGSSSVFCVRVEVAACFSLFAALLFLPSMISSSVAIAQGHLGNHDRRVGV
jgi:hypothetical protein